MLNAKKKKSSKIKEKLYFCKDCQEILCQKHIKEYRINNECIMSIFDLDFLCIKHDKDYISYWQKCNKNLCEICMLSKIHKNHKKYVFKDKILNKEDNNKIDNLLSQGNLTNNKKK